MNPRGLRPTDEGRKVKLDHLLRDAVELCWENDEEHPPGTISNYERGMVALLAESAFSGEFKDAFNALTDKREEMEREAESALDRAEKNHNRAAEELDEARKRMELIRGEEH